MFFFIAGRLGPGVLSGGHLDEIDDAGDDDGQDLYQGEGYVVPLGCLDGFGYQESVYQEEDYVQEDAGEHVNE